MWIVLDLCLLGVDNYQISADWLAPVRDRLQKDLGVPVMYLQGAEGNVDPVSRGALDMADPDQAVGSSFEVLGELAGGMIAALQQARGSEIRASLKDLAVETRVVSLPLRYGGLSQEQVQDKLEGWKEKFTGFLKISREKIPEDWSINAMIKEEALDKGLWEAETRKWVAAQFTYVAFLNIYKRGGEAIDPGKGEIYCSIAVPDFGGWIGYLPHKVNYEEPKAEQLYETVSTMFAQDASLRLLETAEGMARKES